MRNFYIGVFKKEMKFLNLILFLVCTISAYSQKYNHLISNVDSMIEKQILIKQDKTKLAQPVHR